MSIESVPSILVGFPGGDTPRARRKDKVTSHKAADLSQRAMRETKVHVLIVVKESGPIVGSELNDMYRFRGSRVDWKKVAWDSPRKRAGELADDGYLEVVGTRLAGNGTEESVYDLTDKGRALLSLGHDR